MSLRGKSFEKSIKIRSQKRQGRRDKVENFHISFHFSDFFLQTVELDLCIRKKLKSFRGFFGKLCTVYKKGKNNVVSHTYLHSQSAKGTVFEKSSKSSSLIEPQQLSHLASCCFNWWTFYLVNPERDNCIKL